MKTEQCGKPEEIDNLALDVIPENWKIFRLKDFSQIVRGGSPRPAGDLRFYEGSIPFLKVGDLTTDNKVYLSRYTYTIKEAGLIKTRLIPKNTLLLTNSGATLGIPKICTFSTTFNDGIAAFTQLKNVDQVFLFYFLRNRTDWYLNQASLGQGQPNLNIEIIGNTFIALPSISEQRAISTYLDTKTAQIDRKIDLLTQKSQRYEELKRSLINETVTRGLDKSVPMKDSGINWIGDIPEHWEVRRVKDVTTSDISVKALTHLKSIDLIEFVPMSNVDESRGEIKKFSFMELSSVSSGYAKFKNDDVIFAKITPCMENGNVALVKELRYGIGFGSTEFMVFRSRKELLPKYLYYFFYNILFRKNAEPFMKGTAGQKRITSLYMSTHGFSLPPLAEQKVIAEYLDQKIEHIHQIIEKIFSQIEIQKELRKTLINDVVTGKIKVA